MTPATKRHLDAIRNGCIGMSNIIGIRKLLNANARYNRGWSVNGNPADATDDAAVAVVLATINEHKPRADNALHASGYDRLTDRRYSNRWTDSQRNTIDNLVEFRLVGWYEWQTAHHIPVWRAIPTPGTNAAPFDFINPSWQSGGNGPVIF